MIYGNLPRGNTLEMISGKGWRLLFPSFSRNQFSRYFSYITPFFRYFILDIYEDRLFCLPYSFSFSFVAKIIAMCKLIHWKNLFKDLLDTICSAHIILVLRIYVLQWKLDLDYWSKSSDVDILGDIITFLYSCGCWLKSAGLALNLILTICVQLWVLDLPTLLLMGYCL